MVPEYEEAAFAASPGELADSFSSRRGWGLVLCSACAVTAF